MCTVHGMPHQIQFLCPKELPYTPPQPVVTTVNEGSLLMAMEVKLGGR